MSAPVLALAVNAIADMLTGPWVIELHPLPNNGSVTAHVIDRPAGILFPYEIARLIPLVDKAESA